MTDYPAYSSRRTTVLDEPIRLPGKATGLHNVPVGSINVAFNVGALSIPGTYADTRVAVGGGFPAPGTTNYSAYEQRQMTPGLDWWERLHLLPRAGLNFGNIVSTVTKRFELFNAFRHASVSIVAVTNHAVPGTQLPDLPAVPFSLGPMQSLLDPTSTLLAPLGEQMQALRDGIARFDTTVDFTADTGQMLFLRVQGNRIALLPSVFDGEVLELLEWETDIVDAQDGQEQRIAVRDLPRQSFEVELFLTDAERRRFASVMLDWHARLFAVPIWPEQMSIRTAFVGNSGNTINVDSTANLDLRIGALAVVYKSVGVNDFLTVASFTGNSVTFDANPQNSFAVGDFVVPVRLCYMKPSVPGGRPPVNVERYKARFTSIDNHTGAPTGSTSGWNTFNSKVLLDDFNFVDGASASELVRSITVIDPGPGLVTQGSGWQVSKSIRTKLWNPRTRAALWKIRLLLYALRGRQVSLYAPTYNDDLLVVATLTSGTNTMDVEHCDYSRFVQSRHPKKIIRVTFTDGTTAIKSISSAVEVSSTVERLTVDSNWGTTKTAAQVQRVEFIEPIRLNTDVVRIKHDTQVGAARIEVPYITVIE